MKLSRELLDPAGCGTREEGFIPRRKQTNTFNNEVCEIYDLLIGEGLMQNEAIRKTRAILKAINYPSATYDTVITRLRSSGRFRKHSGRKATNNT
jgi:hypothetical protein